MFKQLNIYETFIYVKSLKQFYVRNRNSSKYLDQITFCMLYTIIPFTAKLYCEIVIYKYKDKWWGKYTSIQ